MAANTFKNGIYALFKTINHACRILTRYGPKVGEALDVLVTDGRITSAQGDAIKAFLATVQAACDLLRIASGY